MINGGVLDPIDRDKLLAFPLAVLQKKLPKLRIIACAQVQPAKRKGDIFAVRQIERVSTHAQILAVSLFPELMQRFSRDFAQCHRGDVGVNRDILPNRPWLILTFNEGLRVVIHRAAQTEHTAHIIDIGFWVHVIFIEANPARHVEDICDCRASISGVFEIREIKFDRLGNIHKPVFDGLSVKTRHERLGNRPANTEIIAARILVIAFMDERPVADDDQRRCIEFFKRRREVGIRPRNHNGFGYILNVFRPWFGCPQL